MVQWRCLNPRLVLNYREVAEQDGGQRVENVAVSYIVVEKSNTVKRLPERMRVWCRLGAKCGIFANRITGRNSTLQRNWG